MIRRMGETVKATQKYSARPGAYAILLRGDEVLLTFQETPRPEFQLPGGGIDPGEPTIVALHREVREETGWSIAQPKRVGAYRRFTYMPEYDRWAEKICHVYLSRPVLQRSEPLEPAHTAVWVKAALAPELLASAGDRHFARRLLG